MRAGMEQNKEHMGQYDDKRLHIEVRELILFNLFLAEHVLAQNRICHQFAG
jgi:hypothetical protein